MLPCFNIPVVLQLHSDTLIYITIPMDLFKLALDIFLAPNGDKSFCFLDVPTARHLVSLSD